MAEWAKASGTDGKVTLVSDPRATFTKALGMDADMTKMLGSVRSQRYAMVVDDGVVKALEVEAKIEKTMAEPMMAKL